MRASPGQFRARNIILAHVCTIAIAQIAFSIVLPWWHPDTEYRVRKEMLQVRLAESPGRPLFLMVGSSRVSFAFDPEQLSGLTDCDGRQVLSFNFGHFNSGPTSNLLMVKRLLGEEVRPRWLIVEVLPALCQREWPEFIHMCGWGDIETISQHYPLQKFAGSVLRNHLLVPWFRHRGDLQERYLHERQTGRKELDISRFGWWSGVGDRLDASQRSELTEKQRSHFALYLTDKFRVSQSAELAFRDLLSLCRREGIAVGLLLTPEGETYRSWYSPKAEERLDAFLRGLSAEYHVPVFDTRRWFDDSWFSDSHHLLRPGTLEFTRRFERDILKPFVLGTALGEKLLLTSAARPTPSK